MRFITEVTDIPHRQGLINHLQPIVMLGSCFSDNIGCQLRRRLFDVDINPFGTLYNPLSILEAVRRIRHNIYLSEADIFNANGIWHSWLHDSSFSSSSKQMLLDRANTRLEEAHRHIKEASALVLTFGSAFYYQLASDGRVVANCHKQPASMFKKRMCDSYAYLKQIYDTVRVPLIVTVSPIRHAAEGMHGNSLSKARLLEMINADMHCTDTMSRQCSYFPAYEIMLDELRDYRFYAADMLHPSETAIDYIFNRFENAYSDTDTIALSDEILHLSKRINHRPLVADDPRNKAFNSQTNREIENLIAKHPYLATRINQLNDD